MHYHTHTRAEKENVNLNFDLPAVTLHQFVFPQPQSALQSKETYGDDVLRAATSHSALWPLLPSPVLLPKKATEKRSQKEPSAHFHPSHLSFSLCTSLCPPPVCHSAVCSCWEKFDSRGIKSCGDIDRLQMANLND